VKKDVWSALLLFGIVIPPVMLLWPFAWWGSVMQVVLRVIPAACAQLLACRMRWSRTVKWIPLIVAGMLALWGTWLCFTSPHWIRAAWTGLVADYVSPFLSCAAALALDGAVEYGKRVKK